MKVHRKFDVKEEDAQGTFFLSSKEQTESEVFWRQYTPRSLRIRAQKNRAAIRVFWTTALCLQGLCTEVPCL